MLWHCRSAIFIRILWVPWRWCSCSAKSWSKIDILNIWVDLKVHFVGLSFIIIVFLVKCTVINEDQKCSESWVWCAIVRILKKWTKYWDTRFFQRFCWRLQFFWDRWVTSDPVCLNSCVRDLLFCFLRSGVCICYVSCYWLFMHWVAVD
jgi:hypothetical protein